MLSVCSPPPYLLNTKNMPIWAHFQCLVCIYHPSTIFPPPEHQKHAHMGMFCLYNIPTHWTSKKCPNGHGFNVQCITTVSLPPEWKPCPLGHGLHIQHVSNNLPPSQTLKNVFLMYTQFYKVGLIHDPQTSHVHDKLWHKEATALCKIKNWVDKVLMINLLNTSLIKILHKGFWKNTVAMIFFIGPCSLLSIQSLMVCIHKLKGTASIF